MNNAYMNDTFKIKNEIGTKGEYFVRDVMLNSYGVKMYKCTSRHWQQVDVDYISNKEEIGVNHTTDAFKLEIKTDLTTYTNICLEVVSNVDKETPGWSLITESDNVAVYRPNLGNIYFMDTKKMKEFIKNHRHEYKEKLKHNYFTDGKFAYFNKIINVPIKTLEHEGVIVDIYDVNKKTSPLLRRKAGIN